jgi:hypothetical protein
MPYQAEIWFAITAGAIIGAIAGGAIVYLSKVKEAREAKTERDNRRHFPPPWSVEEQEESFVIKDARGQIISQCCFGNQLTRLWSMRELTKDEARRLATSIANLPRLLSNSLDVTASIELIRDAVEQSVGDIAAPAREHFEDLGEECETIASIIRRSMSNPVIRGQIVEELCKALQQLGADRVLLSIIGGLGSSLNDQEVLTMLRGWNAGEQLASMRDKSVSQFEETETRQLFMSGRNRISG